MRSVRFCGNSVVEVFDADKPSPEPGEVLVDITTSAICGSDLKPYRMPEPPPMKVGHEMVGRVVETTPGGKLKKGDRVGIYVLKGWDEMDTPPQMPSGFIMGGHSEFVAATEANCIPLPDDIPDGPGVLMAGDTMGVAYHVNSRIDVQAGERVMVVGVGPVGLGAVLLFSHLGAKVYAVDQSEYRLSLAKELGAVEGLNPNDGDVVEKIRELTGGTGCDVAVECVGKDVTLNMALNAVGRNGRVGICGEGPEAKISPSDQFIRKELTVYGSWYFRLSDSPKMFEMYRNGMAADKLITHQFPLEEANDAHAKFAAGETGKVILVQD